MTSVGTELGALGGPAVCDQDAERIGPVTAVLPDPRRAGTVRILVDGKPWLTVAANTPGVDTLHTGSWVEHQLHRRLCHAADVEAAVRAGLRALARRPCARQELARRLVQRGHPPAGVEGALGKLTTLGLLDDAAFAAQFIRNRLARGFGPARLRRDLAVRGVDRGLVADVLAQLAPPAEEEDTAPRNLVRERAHRMGGGKLPREAKVRRLVAYLARRGYVGARYHRMVREALAKDPP